MKIDVPLERVNEETDIEKSSLGGTNHYSEDLARWCVEMREGAKDVWWRRQGGATSWLAIGKYTSMEGLGLTWLDDLEFEHRAKEGLLFQIPPIRLILRLA